MFEIGPTIGIAQQLFRDRYHKTLWKQSKRSSVQKSWPLLDKVSLLGPGGYVDVALAAAFINSLQDSDERREARSKRSGLNEEGMVRAMPEEEAIGALIALLSAAARQGHLCVRITPAAIVPPICDLWDLEEVKDIEQLIRFGADCIDDHVPIHRFGDHYYLERNWKAETELIYALQQQIKTSSPALSVDHDLVVNRVDGLIQQKHLLPEQGAALLHASQSTLTLLTGGPGTGKTYTAGILLKTLIDAMSPNDRMACKIALAAPTGKAATHLEQSIRKACPDLLVSAETLHRLLKVHYKENSSPPQLNADIILVDESSMIDIRLMNRLLASVKPGARLILLGDRHQLPPVEMGSIFADLVESLNVIELKTCLRTEIETIIELAHAVKVGDFSSTLQLLQAHFYYKQIDAMSMRQMQRELVQMNFPRFPHLEEMPDDLLCTLELFQQFRILSPLRQGMLGTDALNQLFFAATAEKARHAKLYIVPIMITQNHYQLELYNGEMGLLVKSNQDSTKSFALFSGHEPIPLAMLPPFEYAYCISIHKSQGSEFKDLLILLPEGSQSFGREALYTAITRAKCSIELWSAPETLNMMIEKRSLRQSGIKERVKSG